MEDDHDTISDALLKKERELQHIAKLRITQLQEQLTMKDQYVTELQQRLKRVCEDFNYNFQLIEERDKELASLEQQVSALTSACKAKDADLSDLQRIMQTKEDDWKAEIDFLKLQLEDAKDINKDLKARENEGFQIQQELSYRVESLEAALREKDREIAKCTALLASHSASNDEEIRQIHHQLNTEKARFERLIQEERNKSTEISEEHAKCGVILKECEKRLREEANNLQILSANKDGQIEEMEKKIRLLEEEKSEFLKEIQRLKRSKDAEISEIRSKMIDENVIFELKEQLRISKDALSVATAHKSTLEGVISSLERELDLERKERVKDRRVVRDVQARIDTETSVVNEKNAQWQVIAESRAEEVAVTRVSFR